MPPPAVVELLNQKALQYNHSKYLAADPAGVMHQFKDPADQAVAGFFAATLAWGRRDIILRSCQRLLERMDYAPSAFVRHASWREIAAAPKFVHRTFQERDFRYFVFALRNLLLAYGSLQRAFTAGWQPDSRGLYPVLSNFQERFFMPPRNGSRTLKHVSNVRKGASAKRLAMFLRWMVRKDENGFDLGIWSEIPMELLVLPLDVHTGRVARELGLLQRKQNDWRAVQEVTRVLQALKPEDPAWYDFALFGLGVYEDYPKKPLHW